MNGENLFSAFLEKLDEVAGLVCTFMINHSGGLLAGKRQSPVLNRQGANIQII